MCWRAWPCRREQAVTPCRRSDWLGRDYITTHSTTPSALRTESFAAAPSVSGAAQRFPAPRQGERSASTNDVAAPCNVASAPAATVASAEAQCSSSAFRKTPGQDADGLPRGNVQGASGAFRRCISRSLRAFSDAIGDAQWHCPYAGCAATCQAQQTPGAAASRLLDWWRRARGVRQWLFEQQHQQGEAQKAGTLYPAGLRVKYKVRMVVLKTAGIAVERKPHIVEQRFGTRQRFQCRGHLRAGDRGRSPAVPHRGVVITMVALTRRSPGSVPRVTGDGTMAWPSYAKAKASPRGC